MNYWHERVHAKFLLAKRSGRYDWAHSFANEISSTMILLDERIVSTMNGISTRLHRAFSLVKTKSFIFFFLLPIGKQNIWHESKWAAWKRMKMLRSVQKMMWLAQNKPKENKNLGKSFSFYSLSLSPSCSHYVSRARRTNLSRWLCCDWGAKKGIFWHWESVRGSNEVNISWNNNKNK